MIFNLLCGGIEKKQRIWRTCADVCKNLPFVWIVWEKIKQVLASHPSPIEDNIKSGENKGAEMQKAASMASALVLFFPPAVLIFGR